MHTHIYIHVYIYIYINVSRTVNSGTVGPLPIHPVRIATATHREM